MSGNPDMDGGAVAKVIRNVVFMLASGDRQVYVYEGRRNGQRRAAARKEQAEARNFLFMVVLRR